MTAANAWEEETSGRERVRMVVDTLSEPATINHIATEADVAWETAKSEVTRLQTENKVRERGGDRYEPNPVREFIDQILELIEDHSKAELEAQLEEDQEQVEELETEFGVRSAQEMRRQLTNDDVSTAEMREIRNVSDTWGALELEIRLLKNALHLYDDLTQLSQTHNETPTVR